GPAAPQPGAASRQSPPASAVSLPVSGPPEIRLIRTLQVDHFNGGTPKPPPTPDLSSTEVFAHYQGTSSFNRWHFEFLEVDSYPWETFDAEFGHRQRERRWIEDEALEDQLGTGTMLCQSGITGDRHFIFAASKHARFPSAESLPRTGVSYLPALTSEHVLLFRSPADQDVGHQKGNQLILEFWVTREDLRNRNFDSVVVWEA
ncbi:MAG: hypothetical protein AAGC57_11655, partial [Pseudomonadota bacterium]